MNPYDFVRLDLSRPPQRASMRGHERFRGNNGLLYCRLTTETPVFVADQSGVVGKDQHRRLRFFKVEGVPVIPGSALKGVIRSVAEAAANSCLVLYDKEFQANIPAAFLKCTDNRQLCITCRIFGMLSGNDLYQGNVSISDAVARQGYRELGETTLAPLLTPKPRHTAFYFRFQNEEKTIAGRKFYFHSRLIRKDANRTKFNATVYPVEGSFDFTVKYENLTREELDLLFYSLVLEPGMCHKIGMGKPLGLGSVRIEILRAELIFPDQRYRELGGGVKVLEGERLKGFTKERIKRFTEDNSINLQDLRRIWAWPPTREVRYPSREWFNQHPKDGIEATYDL